MILNLSLFFDKTRKELSQKDYDHAVDRVMTRYFYPMTQHIADFEVDKVIEHQKDQLREMIMKLRTLYNALSNFDMESDQEVELAGKCLWVPANIKHESVSNRCHFVYGGVNLQPNARFVTKGSVEHQVLVRTTAAGSSASPIAQGFINQVQQAKQTSSQYPGVDKVFNLNNPKNDSGRKTP